MSARSVAALCASAVLLSGCVHYRLGVEFDWLGGGRVAQTLDIDSALVRSDEPELAALAGRLQQRTEALGGQVVRDGTRLALTIPFRSPGELSEKFNRFIGEPLASPPQSARPSAAAAAPVLPPASSPRLAPAKAVDGGDQPFRVQVRDRFLWTEYDLATDLDLRVPIDQSAALTVLSTTGALKLEFALTTPLAAFASNSDLQEGNTLTWRLVPGQINRLQASFLVPGWPMPALVLVLLAALLVWRLGRSGKARMS